MKDSIVINMDYAGYDIIDGTPNVQRHHIFGGTANRRLSDEHHQGKMSVHMNKEMRVLMRIIGQLAWEKHYIAENENVSEDDAREAFRKRYGISML